MSSAKQSAPSAARPDDTAASAERIHDEQCVRYSHAMPHDLQESVGRVIIRIVPLLYGGMFGALMDEFPLAMAVGGVASALLDLSMGHASILRSFISPMLRGGCPLIAAAAQGLASMINATGLRAPAALGKLRCGVS